MGNMSNGKFAPRAERKAKKRQRDDMIPDVPEDDTPADSAEQPEAAPTKESRPAKKPRVSKSTKEVVKSETGASSGPKAKKEASSANEEGQQKKAARFIVFVGNLPFTATADSIKQHFKAVHPSSIRNLTKKDDPTKSKGCAFVEFANYDHMKTCLKTFHHSMFNDGISPARKINVELTAGGGGNKQQRQTKITEKNQKLNEERRRRMQEVEKAKSTKTASTVQGDGIHPSRRALVPDARG